MDSDSQRRFAWLVAIVQSSADAILSSDEDDLITTWNPAAERLFGYTAEEAIGQSVLIIVPPDLVEDRRRFLARLIEGGTAQGVETRRVRKDGTLVEVEMTVSPVYDADGNFIGFSNILRDISERKAAEAKVRELEFRYQTFFEYMPGLTYIHSPSVGAPAEVAEYSHQFGVLTGYPASVWKRDRGFLYKIIHPDDREALIESDRKALNNPGIHEVEFRILTLDGRSIWLRDRAQLVFDEEQRPLYWLGFMVDITDRKQAEADAAQALKRLRASNAELERLSNAKSDFVSMISHEFRTPLTSIQGFSELIQTESLAPSEVASFAAMINEGAVRLARMIGNVLDLDRLEAGQTRLNAERLHLNDLIQRVIASIEQPGPEYEIRVTLDPDVPPMLGDADLLERVVANLVTNAIKYSPDGGLITIETHARGRTVLIEVGDQGIGIPIADLETIFVRYMRLSRPEELGVEGTGLGLPIARHIVELHGGRIWATSDGRSWSCLRVELPVRTQSAEK